MRALFFIGFILVAWSTGGVVTAGDEPTDELALGKAEILELVREKSTECRKEKDQSLCTNFFSTEGVFKRRMHDDDARRDGRWFLDQAVADLEAEDGSFHPDNDGVFHHGFDRRALTGMARDAGFRDPAVCTASVVRKPGRDYPVLLLTATR